MESNGALGAVEFKYYLNKAQRLGGTFCSLEMFGKTQFFELRDKLEEQKVRYTLNKNVMAFTFRAGHTLVTRKGFIFEIFGGLGIRYAQNNNSLTKAQNKIIEKEVGGLIWKEDGDKVFVNLQLGCRLGFRLN